MRDEGATPRAAGGSGRSLIALATLIASICALGRSEAAVVPGSAEEASLVHQGEPRPQGKLEMF